jgi:hypothetical protein
MQPAENKPQLNPPETGRLTIGEALAFRLQLPYAPPDRNISSYAPASIGAPDRTQIVSDVTVATLARAQPAASRLIAGIELLIRRAHAQQLIFLCSTLTPYQGSGSWTQQGENTREAINSWIRGSDSGCDAVIDQDAATHDPKNPERYRPEYDSGDHLHPNDDGYRAIARAIPLAAFFDSTQLESLLSRARLDPTPSPVLK